jgi:hypothetical protein
MIGATCAVEPCSLLSHEEAGFCKEYPTTLSWHRKRERP